MKTKKIDVDRDKLESWNKLLHQVCKNKLPKTAKDKVECVVTEIDKELNPVKIPTILDTIQMIVLAVIILVLYYGTGAIVTYYLAN